MNAYKIIFLDYYIIKPPYLYLWVLSVSLLALPEPGVDEVKVLLEVGLLLPHERLVELEEPRPVQALQVQPTSPPHTHAVQDKRTGDVHLKHNKNI